MLEIADFRRRFGLLTAKWNWEVEGFIDKTGYVYPIDTDTKVISTVFERLASPVVRKIAREDNYTVETANQTTYPDFTLTNHTTKHRIAIDVKSTYVRDRMMLTLGGFNSFLRNNTKNILHPYSTYHEHWIIGFVYEQRTAFDEYDLDNMPKHGDIPCPYSMRIVFVRKKHEISGLRAGSGNTKNIGSIIVAKPNDFATRDGPFMGFEQAGKACDYFWKEYERLCPLIHDQEELMLHPEFKQFKPHRALPRT